MVNLESRVAKKRVSCKSRSSGRVFLATFMVFFPPFTASAEQPVWVKSIPFGEIICTTDSGRGVEWVAAAERYVNRSFESRSFTVHRVDAADPGYTQVWCKPDDKPKHFGMGEAYFTSACYRYDNIPSMIGWGQGWCYEKHSRDGNVDIACEQSANLQPKIGFRVGGYFYSYGRIQNTGEKNPFVSLAYTETGTCTNFGKFKKKFLLGNRPAYSSQTYE